MGEKERENRERENIAGIYENSEMQNTGEDTTIS